MNLNPEFTRNTWLELSSVRRWGLALVTVLLVILFMAMPDDASSPRLDRLSWLGLGYVAVSALWGAVRASSSVTTELYAGTWDLQRLAQHRPWDLLLGKLFGSTVFMWVGTAIGLVLYAAGRLQSTSAFDLGDDLLTMVLAVALIQAAGLFISFMIAGMLRGQRRPTRAAAGQFGGILLMFFAVPGLLSSFGEFFMGPDRDRIKIAAWWWDIPVRIFLPLSLALFLGWLLLGTHRQVRAELQEAVSPAPWLGFLVFLTLYLVPFFRPELLLTFGNEAGVIAAVAALVFGLGVYPLLLCEGKDVVRLRGLAVARAQRDFFKLWTELPVWTFTLAGYVLALAVLGITEFIGGRTPEVLDARHALYVGFALALLMLRDAAWILALHLRPGSARRPDLVMLFGLAILYILLPGILVTLKATGSVPMFLLLPFMAVATDASSVAGPQLVALLWGLPGCVLAVALAIPAFKRALQA